MPVDPAPVGNIQGSSITKRVQITGARAPTKVKESRRLLAQPIPGNHVQSRFGTRRLDQRNPGNEMSPIVLRQEKGCVILMTGEIGCRRLGIENLIERGFGSGDSLGECFYPRTYSLEGLFSSRCVSTQSSGLAGNWPIAKVLRGILGLRWGGIVWAGIEFCHEEVDLFTAEKFRDNAEASFIERGGDCCKISHGLNVHAWFTHGYTILDNNSSRRPRLQEADVPPWRGDQGTGIAYDTSHGEVSLVSLLVVWRPVSVSCATSALVPLSAAPCRPGHPCALPHRAGAGRAGRGRRRRTC